MPEQDQIVVKPQTGFQIQFLSSEADIIIGGAAAGVGKSWCVLAAPLRHKDVPRFNSITFRRTTEQIRNPGGLWDKSTEIYPAFNFKPNEQQLEWYYQKGVTYKFAHLQHEKDVYSHDGSEYCLIIFDELQHFTRKQFVYLLSRNRSTCGVRPYVLATCNPDPDSFLAELVEWWIDQEEKIPEYDSQGFPNINAGEKNPKWGFPIKERSGVIRYLVVHKDNYVWAGSKDELIAQNPDIFSDLMIEQAANPHDLIKSVTFISGSIFDNQELLTKNPSYLANLMAQDENERARLFDGNWKVKGADDGIFGSMNIINMFDNIYPSNLSKRFITCDAARFGKDFCTIFVWAGWKVIKLIVLTKSDHTEIVTAIEKERRLYGVLKGHVVVDQDGVGGGVVKIGGYVGFSGNAPVFEDPGTKIKENYQNRKTQFYYRFADRVNSDEVSIALSNENVSIDGVISTKIKVESKIVDVRDLIKQDLRAIRKKDADSDGKKQINEKTDQKRLCGGRSPDFADGMMLRVWWEFKSGEIRVGRPGTSARKFNPLERLKIRGGQVYGR